MKTKAKYWLVLLMAVCMVLSSGIYTKADDYSNEWTVTFTADGVMDYGQMKTEDLMYELSGLQPGDNMTITVNLKNQNKETVDWYMWNRIIESLEDQNVDESGNPIASAGAYTYILTYTGPDGKENDIYRSETVGGEKENSDNSFVGLYEATATLEDYFYMFTTKSGESGFITLYVELEGETQGNDYQDALAELNMRFMVVIPDEESSRTTPPPSPNTGDANTPMPYFVAMGVSGAVILVLATVLVVRRKKEDAAEEES